MQMMYIRALHRILFIRREVKPLGFRTYRAAPLSMALAVALVGCSPAPAPAPATTEPAAPATTAASQVERGRLLVIGGGCHDCHTPKKLGPNGPEPDMDRMLMGHPQDEVIAAPFKSKADAPWQIHVNDNLTAWSGAWGVSFAANLTPDENTGIGIWTDDMFVNALQKGKHMGAGRTILPPMPWNWYGQLPPDDLKAILAYLKSIKPIANRVPVPLGPDGKPLEAPEGAAN
jgi:mono/diheme cytochrome c family protein